MSKIRKLILNLFFIAATFFAFPFLTRAATYYLAANGSDGGDGSISSPWFSLDFALNKYRNDGTYARVHPGDILYLRGGVYAVDQMSVNSGQTSAILLLGTSAASPVTTISTYPADFAAGNPAILDGGAARTCLRSSDVFQNHNVLIENMEVRNCLTHGFDMREDTGFGMPTMVSSTFRNIYFHDNINADVNSNPAGLILSGESCIVENCTFENNGTPGSSHLNSANLALLNSYNSDLGAIDPEPRKNNVVRYNRFIGSAIGVKDKGDSNFVSNNDINSGTGTPVTVHPGWANEIHHNVFLQQASAGYYLQQDYINVHHNIFDGSGVASGNMGVTFDSYDDSNKVVWYPDIHNNTFINNSDSGIGVEINPNYPYGYHWTVQNNLFLGVSSHYLVYLSGNTISKPMTSDYNGFDTAQSVIGRYLNNGNVNFTAWELFSFDVHSINSAMSVTDSSGHDYTLPVGSAAIGAGLGGVDLGAVPFEDGNWYDDSGYSLLGSDNIPPSNPTGLSVS